VRTGVRIAIVGLLAGSGMALHWGLPEPLTPIAAVQGASHLSPLLGRDVTVEGVVIALHGGGFYLQDSRGDRDPATSEGISVAAKPAGLRRGDRARVTGTVAEEPAGGSSAGLLVTRLTSVRAVRVTSRGHGLPAPVVLGADALIPLAIISPDELPVDLRDSAQVRANRFNPSRDALDLLESLEGMLVRARRPTALAPSERRSGGRADVFVLPQRGAAGRHARTAAGGILLRSGPDNRGDQNADRIRVAYDPALLDTPFPDLGTGDRLADVTGVLEYAYGAYQVTAVSPVTLALRSSWRAERTALRRTPAHLTVATYNVLNLSPDSSDAVQRARLGEQITRALGGPDIVALQEIQDESGERDDGAIDGRPTLAALARAIREAGGPAYAFAEVAPADGRPGGVPGGNIRNAFLYDTARVRLEAVRAVTPDVLARAGAPHPGAFADSRDPLEGVFTARGRRLVVINNHLTSRFGSTPVFGAVQPYVQAGETEREAQARALHGHVAGLLAADPAAHVVVLGDMNTFETSDDLASILPGSPPLLVNLVPRIVEPQRYSYIFEGNSQVLDHVFVTAALAETAEVDVVHLNADFAAEHPASDHDPVVARFRW
jgi:predicted extracellular nuclease